MRTAIILLSFILLLWIAGSSYAYVCKIRKDCCKEVVTTSDSTAINRIIDDSLKAAAAKTIPEMYSICFEFNQSVCVLTADDSRHFASIKEYIDANPGQKVLVTGHSDIKGSAAAKEKVGINRADFAKQKLTESGVEPDAVITIGESDRKPIADNSTDEGRAKNRRAEISIQ